MIKRDYYYNEIEKFIDKKLIKVITGLRRSGKSTMLKLIQNKLIDNGVNKQQILYINFESMAYYHIRSAKTLYDHVTENSNIEEKMYLFFDEIQIVKNWEEAINSFMVDFDADIYISGSNSNLLSSELSTLLTGRYVNFKLYPLSYLEMLDFRKTIANEQLSEEEYQWKYIRLGGFPFIHLDDYDEEACFKIISDIYDSIVLRDVVDRYKIRNIEVLNRLIKYIIDNIGNTFSAKSISDYFKSQNRKVDVSTIYNYLSALESSFVISKVNRYDVHGKEILKTQEKYYLADHGIQHAIFGYKDRNISGILENIVYNELLRRDYKVYIGKVKDKEIDFVAEKKNERIYIQVTYKMEHKETIDREFTPLLSIDDHYPKYVLSMDNKLKDNVEGIKHISIFDFLMKKQF